MRVARSGSAGAGRGAAAVRRGGARCRGGVAAGDVAPLASLVPNAAAIAPSTRAADARWASVSSGCAIHANVSVARAPCTQPSRCTARSRRSMRIVACTAAGRPSDAAVAAT